MPRRTLGITKYTFLGKFCQNQPQKKHTDLERHDFKDIYDPCLLAIEKLMKDQLTRAYNAGVKVQVRKIPLSDFSWHSK